MHFGTGKVIRDVSQVLCSMLYTARHDERDKRNTSFTTSMTGATSSSQRAQQARYTTYYVV